MIILEEFKYISLCLEMEVDEVQGFYQNIVISDYQFQSYAKSFYHLHRFIKITTNEPRVTNKVSFNFQSYSY